MCIRDRYKIPYGSTLLVSNNAKVELGQKIATWDPYTRPIISEASGKVKFTDIEEGVSVRASTDELTGLSSIEVIDGSERPSAGKDLVPSVSLTDGRGKQLTHPENNQPFTYALPASALLNLEDGQKITAGEVIARIPLEGSKTKDITGGLPRVADLFEARTPKDAAVLAEESGMVSFGKETKGKIRLLSLIHI